MKRVLITGVAGFVGSHLAELLIKKKGVRVYGLEQDKADTKNIDHIKNTLKLYMRCDIRNIAVLKKAIKDINPDFIFHLAAQSSPSTSYEKPMLTIEVNLMGGLNVLEALRDLKLKPRVIMAGSCDEYGLVRRNENPIKETQNSNPLNIYAVSKTAQDYIGYQYFKNYGLNIIRVRPFHTTGPRQGENFVCSNFAKQIALIEKGKQKPQIYVGNTSVKRDFTDVRDIAKAYLLIMQKGKIGEVYNICSQKSHSIREVLDILLSLSKVKVEVKVEAGRVRPDDAPVFIGDCTKIRKITGWRPEIPLEKTLKDLLNYWRGRQG